MFCLYYLTSTLDDKMYIGLTNNPDRRLFQHLNYTVEKSHYNGNWIRKTLKNGGEIKMNILVSNLTKKMAIQLEIKMIAMFKKLIQEKLTNTAQGGLGFSHKGIPHSDSHKRALEKSQPHKVRIPKTVLYDLYVNQKLSKSKIGQIYGCGATTIDRRLIEYNISARTTPNYKISYKLNREQVLDMFLNQRLPILEISKRLEIGSSGIRYLLQREGISTGLNRFSCSCDIEKLKSRYESLRKENLKKMKTYNILSKEFNLSEAHIYKLLKKNKFFNFLS